MTPQNVSIKAASLDGKAIFYMVLLALQFGVQPIVTRAYIPPDITRSTVILMQEVVKFFLAWLMLWLTNSSQEALKSWTIGSWLSVAFIPAGLYAVQNMAALTAYQNLDALAFNVLNQTKTLSAAFCCYLVMGRKQSLMQILSLFLLLLSALVMEGIIKTDYLLLFLGFASSDESASDKIGDTNSDAHWNTRHFIHGVIPILIASFISGLAGALSQKNLQAAGGGRNPYLFSMELCAASTIILASSLIISSDGEKITTEGFWKGWSPSTFIPICLNSAGGIVVGLVTKYAGSVRKGFALILGIFLSGVIQAFLQPNQQITKEQILGGMLAAISLYLHSANPPSKPVQKLVKQD